MILTELNFWIQALVFHLSLNLLGNEHSYVTEQSNLVFISDSSNLSSASYRADDFSFTTMAGSASLTFRFLCKYNTFSGFAVRLFASTEHARCFKIPSNFLYQQAFVAVRYYTVMTAPSITCRQNIYLKSDRFYSKGKERGEKSML